MIYLEKPEILWAALENTSAAKRALKAMPLRQVIFDQIKCIKCIQVSSIYTST